MDTRKDLEAGLAELRCARRLANRNGHTELVEVIEKQIKEIERELAIRGVLEGEIDDYLKKLFNE